MEDNNIFNFKRENVEALRRVAELYRDAKDMSTTSTEDISKDLCITISNVRAALTVLTNRKYLIKTGNNKAAKHWHLNPEFPGTFDDAVYGNRGAFRPVETEYPKEFKIAGSTYQPPAAKGDWSKSYGEQLNSFRKVAEMARK